MKKHNISIYLAASVSLVTFAVYLTTLRNEFVIWDDDIFFYENLNIRSLNWTFIKWAFTTTSLTGFWHPMLWISHAVNYAIWGINPVGHFLMNVVLHAANTFLVIYVVIWLLEAAKAGEPAIDAALDDRSVLIAAGVTGALFGLHPLNVETVAWLTGRAGLLSTLFTLLSISAYFRYTSDLGKRSIPNEIKAAFRHNYYWSALVCYLLAMASKPIWVAIPVVFIMLDWYPLRRMRSINNAAAICMEKIPFFVLAIIVSIVDFMANKSLGNVTSVQSVTLIERGLVAANVLISYLRYIAYPFGLNPIYPYPDTASIYSVEYYASLLLVCAITAVLIYDHVVNKRRLLISVWGYYLVTLLPLVGIIKVRYYVMADRYFYLPGLGPFLLLGLVSALAWKRAENQQRPWILKRLLAVSAIVLCLAMAALTIRQIGVWNNSIDLWSLVIDRYHEHWPNAYNNRGRAYKELGLFDKALTDYNMAISLIDDAKPLTNRGILFGEKGYLDDALADFDMAIQLDPNYTNAYISRGVIYLKKGLLKKALTDFTFALQLDNRSFDAYFNRGVIFERMGQLQVAEEDFRIAAVINPDDYQAIHYRGAVLRRMGQLQEAIDAQTRAVTLKPDLAAAYLERGKCYQAMGNAVLSGHDYRRACELGYEEGCRSIEENE